MVWQLFKLLLKVPLNRFYDKHWLLLKLCNSTADLTTLTLYFEVLAFSSHLFVLFSDLIRRNQAFGKAV